MQNSVVAGGGGGMDAGKLVDASGVVDEVPGLFFQNASSHNRAWSKTSSSVVWLKSRWSKYMRKGSRTSLMEVSIWSSAGGVVRSYCIRLWNPT